MSLPSNLTDQQLYVIFATHFATIDVHLQDLINTAQATKPELIPQILQDWQDADINQARARQRLFVGQSNEVKSLTENFVAADKAMRTAFGKLQSTAAGITKVAGFITGAVGAASTLLDKAPKQA